MSDNKQISDEEKKEWKEINELLINTFGEDETREMMEDFLDIFYGPEDEKLKH